MQKRKTPKRMCVGCREMMEKKALKRVVRSPQGEITLDLIGKAPGRGAYVCSKACLERAVKTRAIERALGHKLDEGVLESLKETLLAKEAQDSLKLETQAQESLKAAPPAKKAQDNLGEH